MPVAMEAFLDKGLREACAEVLALLVARGATVSVAESLTGGMIGAALTTPAGSSAAFRGGVIVYATELKHLLLAVPADLLAREGAVDPRVAAAMASGVRALTRSDYGLAVTGVAGPDPQDGKPVGTVHIALSGPDDRLWHRDPVLAGDRAQIRAATVRESVDLLRGVLESSSEEHFV
jgi:nicotinamide-nucleotide amidase